MTRRMEACAWAVLAVFSTTACVHEMSDARTAPGTSTSPAVPWNPPSDGAGPGAARPGATVPGPGTSAPPAIPADLLEAAAHWTLTDLIDLALRNSPETRVAWAQARSAAADLGSKGGAYYPSIAGQVTANATQGSVAGGKLAFYSSGYTPAVTLGWLLLDFGGRRATIDSARQALIAADWAHNASIQDVVLGVQRAYYQYLNARALQESEATSLKEAQASLDAAEARRKAGLSTIADVLQAKTVLSQAQLALETVEGQIETIRGGLATAMGLPANTRFEVSVPEAGVPGGQAEVEVERAIQDAQELRPELAGARADVERAKADVRLKEAADRPFINMTGNYGRNYFWLTGLNQTAYNATLQLVIPIFNGSSYQYNLIKARSDQDAAQARLETLQQDVTLQVWTSYYDHRTAAQKVETARDLLDSASESFNVVTARYKAGVGSILDLLISQSALESARAQQVLARTDWFLTLAQLAHDTGTLWRPGPAGAGAAPTEGLR